MHSLPSSDGHRGVPGLARRSAQCLPAALDIARQPWIAACRSAWFPTGTNLVVALDDRLVLKMFPPLLRAQFVSERASLSQLRGRLSLPIPEIVVEGERDRWPYLVITRLAGIVGAQVWLDCRRIRSSVCSARSARPSPKSSARRSANCMHRAALGCVHAPADRRDAAPGISGSACRKNFSTGLEDLLRDAATLIPMNAPPVILIGEYIPENFLLSRDGGGLAAVGAVRFRRRDDRVWRIRSARPERVHDRRNAAPGAQPVRGFRLLSADIDPALKRRLMALMLLHRASDPIRHICIEGWQEKAGDLFELQELLWPVVTRRLKTPRKTAQKIFAPILGNAFSLYAMPIVAPARLPTSTIFRR